MSDPHSLTENGKTHTLGALPKAAFATMTGLDIFERMMAGDLPAPPIMVHSNIRMKEFSEGRAVFTGQPAREFLNPLGTVHGGWI